MRVSIIVPSRDCRYLSYLLFSLREQISKPHEIVLVVKDCSTKDVENMCTCYGLRCIIVEQEKGFFTTALNMGKRVAKGDIVLFTDDDALAPKGWIKRYIKVFSSTSEDVGCVSSRDIYVKLGDFKVIPARDDYPYTKLYRWFIRTWLESPLEVLKEYRFGVYISRSLIVVHGPYLPDRFCLSLPYRGVNMGFRGEIVDIIEFPEHPELKRAPGNEQYAGLKLILNGFKSIYIPSNPILHIHREESLSRTKDISLRGEAELMKALYLKMLLHNSRCK